MKIAVLGSGAMGSLYGGFLSQANDVWLIDIWKEHVDTINRDGLRITEGNRDFIFRPRAVLSADEVGIAELAIIFVKSVNTAEALTGAKSLFGPNTMVLTLQNGLGNAEDILPYVGEDNLFVGTSTHGGTVYGPGHIFHARRDKTHVGVIKGSPTRAQRVVDALISGGFDADVAINVMDMIWHKIIINTAINGQTALLRVTNGFLKINPSANELARVMVREAAAVAAAEGIRLNPEAIISDFFPLDPSIPDDGNRSSMYQDVLNMRKTEVERINGAVMRLGAKHGIPTPYNHMVTLLINATEAAYTYEGK